MNDKELVSRMQHGDMQAFDELYERYKDDAYRLACLITGSRTDGEDLAQEAFVTCAQSIKSLRDGSKFRPWLLKTLSRAAWKYCRKAKRETPVSEFFDTGGSAESALPPYCGRMSSAVCTPLSTRWTKNAALPWCCITSMIARCARSRRRPA